MINLPIHSTVGPTHASCSMITIRPTNDKLNVCLLIWKELKGLENTKPAATDAEWMRFEGVGDWED